MRNDCSSRSHALCVLSLPSARASDAPGSPVQGVLRIVDLAGRCVYKLYIYTYICMCKYTCISIGIFLYIYIYINMCTCMGICNMYIHIYVYAYIYKYMHLFVYIYPHHAQRLLVALARLLRAKPALRES